MYSLNARVRGDSLKKLSKWTQHLTSATIFDNYSDFDSGEDNISEPESQADVNENLQLKQATQGKLFSYA